MRRELMMLVLIGAMIQYVCAQGPNNTKTYYQAANGKSGKALKTAMYNIIKAPHVKGYKSLPSSYAKTDLRPDGKVRDRYSCITNYSLTDNTGGYSDENDMYNKEHSFPKSWFGGKKSPMYSDLMHVIPADGYVNNRRGNLPFGENKGEVYQSANGYSSVGACTVQGYTGNCFEPDDEWKGDFARIYFYMATCYEEAFSNWSGAMLAGNSYPCYKEWALDMLMRWSKNDPVSDIEIARNNAVYGEQLNRNPFVDYPGLEEYIWGDKIDTPFSYAVTDAPDPVDPDDPTQDLKKVELEFSETEFTVDENGDFTPPVLYNPQNVSIFYETSNEDVALVDEQTGYVVIGKAGLVTITAVFAGDDEYAPASAYYTIRVIGEDDPEDVDEIFTKVTNDDEIVSGCNYLLVYEEDSYEGRVFGGVNEKNVGLQFDATISDATIDNSESQGHVVKLLSDNGNWLIKDGEMYLAYTSSGGNKIYAVSSSNEKGTHWKITMSKGITNIDYNDRKLQYNVNDPRFCCYKSTQKDVVLYKELPAEPTGIKNISSTKNVSAGYVYDLQGRKVCQRSHDMSLRKGIYIVNGKKRVVR